MTRENVLANGLQETVRVEALPWGRDPPPPCALVCELCDGGILISKMIMYNADADEDVCVFLVRRVNEMLRVYANMKVTFPEAHSNP